MKKTINELITVMLVLIVLITSFTSCEHNCFNNQTDNSSDIALKELQNDSDLVIALTDYLKELFDDHDMTDTSVAIKMQEIKKGKQALLVDFDPLSYYFVCGYYNANNHKETSSYCCVSEYTWVKCNNVNEIVEKYKDNEFVVAFQINKLSFAKDIISEESSVPNMEHFQIYNPDFNNGINTESTIFFDKEFIYLNSTDKSTIYHSTSVYYNNWVTLPCINLYGRYYLTAELYVKFPDGTRSDVNNVIHFGEYYDDLTDIMIIDKYSITDEQGRTLFYGLFDVDEFANIIRE